MPPSDLSPGQLAFLDVLERSAKAQAEVKSEITRLRAAIERGATVGATTATTLQLIQTRLGAVETHLGRIADLEVARAKAAIAVDVAETTDLKRRASGDVPEKPTRREQALSAVAAIAVAPWFNSVVTSMCAAALALMYLLSHLVGVDIPPRVIPVPVVIPQHGGK